MANTQVGMGECCLSGKLNTSAKPVGRVEDIGGLSTYVSEPSSGSKAQSVIFLTDIFGYELPNTRLLADQFAKAGFYVYVPDVQQGDPIDISFLDDAEPNLKTREQLSIADKGIKTAKVGATLPPWLVKHREGVTRPIIDGFVNTVKMTPGTNKVGAVGFCWGGRYAILLAHSQVDAAVAYHPSLISVPGDFNDVSKPLAIAAGDKDGLTDVSLIKQCEEVLQGKPGVASQVKIYPDQVHGFALRGDWSSTKDKNAMDEAEKQGVDWLKKYLA